MKVYLIGAGPGDPGLFTLRGRDCLAAADVVIYDALANDALLGHARKDAELIYVGKVAGDHALPQDGINRLLVEKAREGKVVARLKGGDPYIFGRGGEEAEALLEAGIPFEEVPGISSTIAAPAYAGIPLTHRNFASSVTIITGHENPDKPGSVHNWQALAQSASTLVFVMGMKNLPDIARNLLDAGMDPATPAALVYRGTTPRQRSLVATLAALPQAAVDQGFSNPSVIVVGKVCSLHDQLGWFEQRPLFGRSVVVTRAREQASGLAQELVQLGADVIQCPTIEISPLPDYAELDAAIDRLSEYAWLIFTSVNGVRWFWKRLEAAGKDSRALGLCRVAAIGPATAEALEARGIRPDFIPERYVAEGVVEGLLARGKVDGVRMLLPRAAKAREVLPDELRKAGARVDVISAYETIPAAARKDEVLERMRAGTLDCVTFGSSSTVENFLSLIPAETLRAHPDVRLAAIGPVTAKTLEAHGLPCHIMPEEYTIPALVQALVSHYTR
ncbi:uroporphyrinogen-III C-methyltransferase [uncultured Desulfovibrio sp.]|uniref:uroporphyrinogen-III C-methyltransferase n=1 Tax=uncultured Desulfovibrio sp. TaxID=167968 RepID=UPI0026374CBB|nr:uroporphyrinogen-III C-methyltransferase [uncultured Desulfovibrio sp.]